MYLPRGYPTLPARSDSLLRGLRYALPISLLLWVLIGLVVLWACSDH